MSPKLEAVSKKRIKAVLFDMGNTLIKYDYGLPARARAGE